MNRGCYLLQLFCCTFLLVGLVQGNVEAQSTCDFINGKFQPYPPDTKTGFGADYIGAGQNPPQADAERAKERADADCKKQLANPPANAQNDSAATECQALERCKHCVYSKDVNDTVTGTEFFRANPERDGSTTCYNCKQKYRTNGNGELVPDGFECDTSKPVPCPTVRGKYDRGRSAVFAESTCQRTVTESCTDAEGSLATCDLVSPRERENILMEYSVGLTEILTPDQIPQMMSVLEQSISGVDGTGE